MVRLKEYAIINFAKIVKISIPYGAIKRAIKFYNLGEIYKFQFLMVRLKGKSLIEISNYYYYFNSLWCD